MSTTSNTSAKQIGTAVYKGRDYALLYHGATQYGERMKLAFTDNLDETFWIDADRAESFELFEQAHDEDGPPRERPRKRRPADDGPRRQRRQENAPADERNDDGSETCYCNSCGQPLPPAEDPPF